MMQGIIEVITKYFVQELCGLLVVLVGLLWKQIKNIHREMDAIRGGVRGNLRMQIKQEAKTHLEKGNISIEDREILQELFDEYFALKGNGPVKLLKEEIDHLPTKIEGDLK